MIPFFIKVKCYFSKRNYSVLFGFTLPIESKQYWTSISQCIQTYYSKTNIIANKFKQNLEYLKLFIKIIADCIKFINTFDRNRLMLDDNYLTLINYLQLLSTYSLKILKLFTFYLKLEIKEDAEAIEDTERQLNCFDIFNEIWKQYYELTIKLKENNLNTQNSIGEIRDLCFYSQFYLITIKYLKESFNLCLKYSNSLNIIKLTKIIYLLYYLFGLKSIETSSPINSSSNLNDNVLFNDFKLAKLLISKCFRSLNNSEMMQNGLKQLNEFENIMILFENTNQRIYLTNLMANDGKYLP